jgi:hypothetical protein
MILQYFGFELTRFWLQEMDDDSSDSEMESLQINATAVCRLRQTPDTGLHVELSLFPSLQVKPLLPLRLHQTRSEN